MFAGDDRAFADLNDSSCLMAAAVGRDDIAAIDTLMRRADMPYWASDVGRAVLAAHGRDVEIRTNGAWWAELIPADHDNQARRAIMLGDLDRARSEARLVDDDFSRQWLASEIAMKDGSMPPTANDADWARTRRGEVVDASEDIESMTSFRDVVAEAELGDGAALAAWLRTSDPVVNVTPMIIGVLPRVRVHRSELAAALRFVDTRDLAGDIFRSIDHLAVRRDLARLAGDDELARTEQRVIERRAAMLADHRRLIALQLWTW
jgi:hypothetical protein